MKLLGAGQDAKTVKGESYGYLTGILYLAPANESGVMNTCQFATEGCKAACLYTAGRAEMFPKINQARIRKTLWLHKDRVSFMDQLRKDISSLIRQAKRMNLKPAVRLNGTSDMPWMVLQLCSEFPEVQFYDYTKLPKPWTRLRDNYHITFSHSERNLAECMEALQHGVNVAVAFHVKRGQPLPETWNSVPVIDGDLHDLRFLDHHRLGLVIGLRAKGRAKKDKSGFVQIGGIV